MQKTQNSNVKDAIAHHVVRETERQIANLEKVFDLLGEKPEKLTCHAAEGLKQEHDALKQENPPELGNLTGAANTEHYEIASYAMLVQLAKDPPSRKAAELDEEIPRPGERDGPQGPVPRHAAWQGSQGPDEGRRAGSRLIHAQTLRRAGRRGGRLVPDLRG